MFYIIIWELSSLSTCYCSFVQEANEEEDDDDEPDDEDDDEDDEEDEDGFQMVEPNLNQADIMIVGEGDEFEDVLPTQATTAPEEPEAPPSIMADVDSDGGGRNFCATFYSQRFYVTFPNWSSLSVCGLNFLSWFPPD